MVFLEYLCCMYQLSVSSVQVVYQEIIFTDQDSQQ